MNIFSKIFGSTKVEKHINSNHYGKRCLHLEPLEDRQMLSAVPVTTWSDIVDEHDNVTSIREAIAVAAPGDTITFAPSVFTSDHTTITLTSGELTIDKSLEIQGEGKVTIDADGKSRVINITGSGSNVTLDGLTLTGGTGGVTIVNGYYVTIDGAAVHISNGTEATITNSIISGNATSGDDRLGTIANEGTVTIANSSILNNQGNGIHNATPLGALNSVTATINNSVVSYNSNNGILNFEAPLNIADSIITNNGTNSGSTGIAANNGIYAATSVVTVTNSLIADNVGRGFSVNGQPIPGQLNINDSTIAGNLSIGILVYGSGIVNLHDSILVANGINTVLGISDVSIPSSGTTFNGYNTLSSYTGWTNSATGGSSEYTSGMAGLSSIFVDAAHGDYRVVESSLTTGRGYVYDTDPDTPSDPGASDPPSEPEMRSTIVTTLKDIVADDGVISLREAIAYAGTNGLGTTITFTSSLFDENGQATITLSNASGYGALSLNKSLEIQGEGKVTINAANQIANVIDIAGSDSIVKLSGLTIKGGTTYGVFNQSGNVTIDNSVVSNNSFVGIFVQSGTAEIVNTVVSNNGYVGVYGDVYYRVTVKNSLIAENDIGIRGNSFSSNETYLKVYNSTIANNTTDGIYVTKLVTGNPIIDLYNTILTENGTDYHDSSAINATAHNTLSSYTGWLAGSENNLVYNPSLPLFVDSEHGDYHLAEHSQAIDRGNDTFAVDSEGNPFVYDITGETLRILGNAVDVGAYESPYGLSDSLVIRLIGTTENSVTLEWIDQSDVTFYTLQYKTYDTNWEDAASENIPVNTESYIVANLTASTTYNFRLTAWYNEASSKELSEITVTTADTPLDTETPSTIVTTLEDIVADDGVISLREAITYAGTNGLGTTIIFAASLFDENGQAVITLSNASGYGTLSLNKSLAIQGEGKVTIDAANQIANVIHITGSGSIVKLSGLTIKGGTTFGVYNQSGNVTIDNSVISDNSNSGIAVQSGTAEIVNTVVSNNNFYGVYGFTDYRVTVKNSLITENAVGIRGESVNTNETYLKIYDSTIASNITDGVYIRIITGNLTPIVEFYNTILVGNETDYHYSTEEVPYTAINAVAHNTLSSYEGWLASSENNIVYDSSLPLFVDAVNGNYHLAERSQAIDRGNNAFAVDAAGKSLVYDITGETLRILGNAVDIGAYESPYNFPDSPLLVLANITENSVALEWTGQADVTLYTLQYKTSDADWIEVTLESISPVAESYTVTGLTASTTYNFRLIAWYNGKPSKESNTITVTTADTPSTVVTTLEDIIADDGVMSLREAIAHAGTNDLGTTITFASSLFDENGQATITLSNASGYGRLLLNKSLEIQGEGKVTIDAANRIAYVINITGSDSTVTLSGLTIKGGTTYGVFNQSGNVTIDNSVVSNNGSGIDINAGTAEIVNTIVSNNNTYGIYGTENYRVTVKNSLIIKNQIGIYGTSSNNPNETYLKVYDSTIANNTAEGIYVRKAAASEPTVELYNTILAVNKTDYRSIKPSGWTIINAVAHNTLSSYTDWLADSENNIVYDSSLPLFVDAANGDYRLAEHSQAIDRGNDAFAVDAAGNPLVYDITGETLRILGNAVDIGAYESPYEFPDTPSTSIVVTTEEDQFDENPYDNGLSLREAILLVTTPNEWNTTGLDKITFVDNVRNIQLLNGQLTITSALTIDGTGVTLTAADNTRILTI
ncbi:MAG: right-handed parallel beta-helix repeat-containing protein, partial [Planctomycetaceae bacterium]|nr:right-handed parallel beta-helix repeat-containing protein [Planctomycetaceae bacterium]